VLVADLGLHTVYAYFNIHKYTVNGTVLDTYHIKCVRGGGKKYGVIGGEGASDKDIHLPPSTFTFQFLRKADI
jgi:hypothetical protein